MGEKAIWEVLGEKIVGIKILWVIPKVEIKEAEEIRVAQGMLASSLDGGIEVCDQRNERSWAPQTMRGNLEFHHWENCRMIVRH